MAEASGCPTARGAAWLLALWTALAALPAAGEAPAERLAEAIRFPTISHQDRSQLDGEAFRAFHAYLERSFPRVHAQLRREVVAGYSLLYTWEGAEPALEPILLTAHIDVVPVPPGTQGSWSHPPFAGVIADGHVWGRGALDDKVGVLGLMEAAEGLLAEGFQPRRSVILAFGHDEEVGGDEGAGAITDHLEAQGVQLWFSLDEGMAISEGAFPGVAAPVAMIGVAEKGYLTLRLTARAAGGHSSVPPADGAIPQLSRALVKVSQQQQPARIDGVVADMLEALAPHMAFPSSLVMAHPTFFGPVLRAQFDSNPGASAMMRTTTALTVLEAGVKENVLPRSASALANFRLIPGDSPEEVVERVRRSIGDPGIEIEIVQAREASQVSDFRSDSFALLAATLAEVAPDAAVAPALVLGGTDTKHYGRIARNSYRFTPFRLGPGDLTRVHGVDERVSVAGYREVIRFYQEMLRRAE